MKCLPEEFFELLVSFGYRYFRNYLDYVFFSSYLFPMTSSSKKRLVYYVSIDLCIFFFCGVFGIDGVLDPYFQLSAKFLHVP